MRIWKRLLYCLLGLFGVALLGFSLYGMGGDILNVCPLAMSKILIGIAAWCIILPIIIVFIVGAFKIVDWVKKDVEFKL